MSEPTRLDGDLHVKGNLRVDGKGGLPEVTEADNGRVLGVEDGKWAPVAGGGGGDKLFTVTAHYDSDTGDTTLDKSISEIASAYNTGKVVVAVYDDTGMPLWCDSASYDAEMGDGEARFSYASFNPDSNASSISYSQDYILLSVVSGEATIQAGTIMGDIAYTPFG